MTDGPSPHLTPDELEKLARRNPAAERTPECRDEAEIALLLSADDRGEDAAAFLTHAATCDYCGLLVEAAVNATQKDDDEDRALMTQLKTAGPEWQRQMARRFADAQKGKAGSRLWTAAALLAMAAALVFAVRIALPLWRGSSSRPELQELVAAVGSDRTRPVEGRLTGGFHYAPPPTLQRGPGEQASPRVRIAEAKLEEAARANDTPDNQAALAVGLLAVGDLDKAIDALEEAVQQKPTDARFQSDLSAAYLARAKWRDRAEDWPRALAAAEHAVKADPKLAEAYFNRALALEGLYLNEQAAEAWSAYQTIEKMPRWRDEAGERAQKLKQRSSAAVPRGNQEAREHIEDVLLMKWGEAVLTGDQVTAAKLLNEAEKSAAALVAAGGDTMARDELTILRRAASTGQEDLLKMLAEGHVLYGRSRVEFLSNRLQQAVDLMTRAATAFESANSPYRFWRPVYAAILLRVKGSSELALEELVAVPVRAIPDTYYHLRGRHLWTRAVALQNAGRFDLERRDLEASSDYFHRSAELENLCAVEAGLAEAESLLGNRHRTWRHELTAMAYVDLLPPSVRRNAILLAGALFALNEGLPDAALHFLNRLIRSLEHSKPGVAQADAYIRRARVMRDLGDLPAAVDDLTRAERAAGDIDDPPLRLRTVADLNRARGDVLRGSRPREAILALDASFEYFRRAGPANRLPELWLHRAQASEAEGDLEGAERAFAAAVASVDRDRAALMSPQDRMQAFEQQRRTAKELIRFQAVVLAHDADALRTAEHSRTQSLVESAVSAESLAFDPISWHLGLPSDVGVIYYAALDDRVLTWALTKESSAYFVRAIPALRLQAMVSGVLRQIEHGANVVGLVGVSDDLVAQLVAPALERMQSKSRIVFIPDGALFRLPFGALPDRQGRPLILSRIVAIAPSLVAFARTSRELSDIGVDDVLAVGDGHDPASSGLPRLAVANDEAIAVGRIYGTATVLTGAEATRARFLASEPAVIHFAGHAAVNSDYPLFSRMFFASAAGGRDDGTMLALEIARHHFSRAKVVVLASCDSAGGRIIEGEGVMSLARMFIDAGVPAVVASLWPVDDAAHDLLLTFHRELRAGLDPAAALRAAQLRTIQTRPDLPVLIWGGFVSLGGLGHFLPV